MYYSLSMKNDDVALFSVEDARALVSSNLFDEFLDSMLEAGCSLLPSFSRCALAYGWNIKVRKASRPVAVVYPRSDGFTVLVVIGRKERLDFEALLPRLSDFVRDIWSRATEMNGQRWLMIDVSSVEILADAIALANVRMTKRKPATN